MSESPKHVDSRAVARRFYLLYALLSTLIGVSFMVVMEYQRCRREAISRASTLNFGIGGAPGVEYRQAQLVDLGEIVHPSDSHVFWQRGFVCGRRGPDWLRTAIGVSWWQKRVEPIEGIYLNETTMDDGDASIILRFPSVRTLELSGTSISDEALLHVSDWKELSSVDLSRTAVGAKGTRVLSRLKALRTLRLSGCKHVNDAAVEELVVSSTLEEVWLDGTGITNSGLARLMDAAQLRRVIVHSTAVTSEGEKACETALPTCDVIRDVNHEWALLSK